jgi:CRP-like cAMP-binding protein
MTLSDFTAVMLDPAHFLTHLPYALLVISMMMNDMGWLRGIAISAGVIRIINRAFIQIDPIIVFWEIIFVAVNVIQLAILWWYAKRHRFSDDEQRFASIIPASIERRTVRRLLRLAKLRHIDTGDKLTVEGKPVSELMFVADGVAQIEKGGRIVAVCGPGDFVGEMSFVSGDAASATAIAAKPMRYLAFDQQRLRAAIETDGELRQALDASFNANLVGKLAKANAAPA